MREKRQAKLMEFKQTGQTESTDCMCMGLQVRCDAKALPLQPIGIPANQSVPQPIIPYPASSWMQLQVGCIVHMIACKMREAAHLASSKRNFRGCP